MTAKNHRPLCVLGVLLQRPNVGWLVHLWGVSLAPSAAGNPADSPAQPCTRTHELTEQPFSNLQQIHLEGDGWSSPLEFLIQWVQGGNQESAFLLSSQVMLSLPHLVCDHTWRTTPKKHWAWYLNLASEIVQDPHHACCIGYMSVFPLQKYI